MEPLTANRVGRINSSGKMTVNNDTSDIYLSNSNSDDFVGVLEFTKSINDILKIKAESWTDIYFYSAYIQIKERDDMPETNFNIGIGTSNPGGNLNLTNATAKEQGVSPIFDDGSINRFSIANLFYKIPKDSSFTPSTSTWYVFLSHPNVGSGNRRYQRMDNYKSFLFVEGIIASNLHYNNGTSWERCIPYYYDGANWIQCQANYYDGNSWIKT